MGFVSIQLDLRCLGRAVQQEIIEMAFKTISLDSSVSLGRGGPYWTKMDADGNGSGCVTSPEASHSAKSAFSNVLGQQLTSHNC